VGGRGYLFFQPETMVRSHTSLGSATDASACNPSPAAAVQLAPTTELHDPVLVLSPTSTVAAAAAASWGSEEQPTTVSASPPPLPACDSSACKLRTETNKSYRFFPTKAEEGEGGSGTSALDLRRSWRPCAPTDHTKHRILPGTHFPRSSAVMERRHMQYHRAINKGLAGDGG
jgi:hypothetical protein